MKKVIVYFHGFGSSSNSTKVSRLRKARDSAVYAWDIDVDPSKSIPELLSHIDNNVMLHKLHKPCEIVFVGTSLGAWYASKLADLYGVTAILINPAYNPAKSLQKYNLDVTITSQYDEISWNTRHKYFIAKNDEVIDFSAVQKRLAEVDAVMVDSKNHRFDGTEFEMVIDAINCM
jgi:predicted esterase YcpF (UPF0227 family)